MQKQMIRALSTGVLGVAVGWTAGHSVSVSAASHAQESATAIQQSAQAAYFSHSDMDTVWKDLEARNAINKRVVEGGKYSINIRTVRETDAPLVHSSSIDIWIMQEGSATAVTGGKLVDPVEKPMRNDLAGSSITGGIEQTFSPGDILYVPAGMPHSFKNAKGFRAYLIRFDLK
jgi:mannose-6-phosphate isomerase-like protein (cupin superfamily)